MDHRSLWIATTPETSYPSLQEDIDVDVAVIGAGITGLTIAYLLIKKGVRVAVIEANRIAASTSGYTTGKITSLQGLTYADLMQEAGEEQAHIFAEANQAAIERIAMIVEEERIDCDFRRAPAFTFATSRNDVPAIEAEVEAAQKLDLPVSFTTDTGLPFRVEGAIRMEDQAMFHPRKYLLALAACILRNGGAIYEHTRATDVLTDNGCEVITRHGRVRAGQVVLATQIPFLDRGGFFAKTSPSKSYLLAARIEGDLPDGMYLGTGETSHTIRPQTGPEGSWLITGGEDHKVGQDEDTRRRYDALEAWTRATFPVREISYSWSGQDYMPVDNVPYIGKLTPMSSRIFVATGFRKWGMTTGMIAGIILSDLIEGKRHPWLDVYDASRIDITRSAKRFIAENMNVATRFVWDRISRLDAGSVDDLIPDSGGIVEIDGTATAAYRDHEGLLHAVSPTCAHLGCSLSWNTAERTWDCPCHGSRYDVDGHVIQGPSVRNLERRDMG
ncbi:MAG TPA: FAD-dependent oxidoreductase [Thermomicrobiales bacterium]|nr:FAD-dependent oxidoreductase [Thermomicrobiales bacterium]